MGFYIFLFFICIFALILNNYLKESDKKYVEIGTVVVLCIMSGTRYYLGGTDYYIYHTVYDNLPKLKDFILNYSHLHEYYKTYGFETGFLLYNSFLKTIGINFYGFTLINSIIFYACFYKGYQRYCNNFNLLIIVFLYKLFFYNTFISMRQSIALAIFFATMHLIEEKKLIKYFLCCFLALLFHNSALFLFPLYFINKIKLTRKKIIVANLIFIPSMLVSYLHFPVMKYFGFILVFFNNTNSLDKANKLLYGDTLQAIGIFHTLEYFLIMFFVIWYYNKIIKISTHANFILVLFLILLPILTLFRGYEILTRIKDYFTLTYGVILLYLCDMDDRRRRGLVQIAAILICAFGFFRFILLFDKGGMIPYQSYLLKGISIFY